MTPAWVLLHSPLTTAAGWGEVPGLLPGVVHAPDVTADAEPPYASRYVADAALQLLTAGAGGPVVLVGHSGAGPLLPLVGAARRAARATVAAYVFLDAGLPARPGPAGAPTRLSLLHAEEPSFAASLERLLAAGGRFPDYGAALPPELAAALRPRPAGFFTEPLPTAPDWPDAPCGYVQLSGPYDAAANQARLRGWPVVRRDAEHFAAWTDPALVVAALVEVRDALLA